MANISLSRRHSYLSAQCTWRCEVVAAPTAWSKCISTVSHIIGSGFERSSKKNKKQQNKTKLLVCHGSTLDLKIKNMETSKQEILCKCCRAKVCSCSPPCQPATSPLEKQKRRRVRCCSKARLPGGPPETGKANSASGKVEIMENVEMKVSSAIFSPHDSKIAPF